MKNVKLLMIAILLLFAYIVEAQKDSTIKSVSGNNLQPVQILENPLLGTCSDGITVQIPDFANKDKKIRGVVDFGNAELPVMKVIENTNLRKITNPSITNPPIENILKEDLLFEAGDVIGEAVGQTVLKPSEFSVFEINTTQINALGCVQINEFNELVIIFLFGVIHDFRNGKVRGIGRSNVPGALDNDRGDSD